MKFFAPHWLWSLLILPLLYGILLFDEKRRQNQFAQFADRKIWSLISPEMIPDFRLKKARYFLASLAFAILALARPQFGTHEESVKVSGLDIMVALDVSNSMEVEDVVPSRLQKARHVIRSLVNHLDGDRVGVVAFAGSSYVASPLTTDLYYLVDTVQMLGPKMIQNQGTDVGSALETAYKALERGGEEVSTTSNTIVPSHVILLISDGEDHEANAIQIAEKLKEKATKLYVLGVGTESGGPIPIKDEAGKTLGFKKDRTGKTIVSTFRPTFLQELAKAADGKYWNVTPSEGEVQDLLQELGRLTRGDYAERRFVVYEDRYQIPLAIAIILLILEISVPARKILALILICIGMSSTTVRAEGVVKAPPSLDAYLENKRGIEAYKKGNIEEAQKEFGAAQARDPSRPELEYNQGVVDMQKGEIDRAIESFKSSARGADQNSNSSLLGKSLYNLGNAFAKKGKAKDAVQSYLGAIQSAIQSKDEALEYEARKNLQLLVNQEQQKKQPQQQQDQKEQEKKEQENSDQKKQPDQKDQPDQNQKDKQGQENQPNRKDQKDQGSNESSSQSKEQQKAQGDQQKFQETPQEMRSRPFQSKKLTPEDANRVMSELTNKERELQEKLQKQHAKSQSNPKDW